MAEWPELGERIRQRIRELGYQNAGQFADAKGYRITYIYKWIAGTMPKRANLHRLAEDLDVTPAWLLFGDEVLRERRPPVSIAGGSAVDGPQPLAPMARRRATYCSLSEADQTMYPLAA